MKILLASVACALLLAGSGCARRQMMKQQSAMRQQEARRQQAAADAQPRASTERRAAAGEAPGEVAEGVAVKEGQLGSYLVDDQGRTLYLFTPDKSAQGSTCYEDCAEAWPPALAEGRPEAQHPSVREDQLGTIRRDDGTTQLTYNGWPLYYYTRDRAPGQVTGQDVHEFGGEWYLLDPEGERVEAEK